MVSKLIENSILRLKMVNKFVNESIIYNSIFQKVSKIHNEPYTKIIFIKI